MPRGLFRRKLTFAPLFKSVLANVVSVSILLNTPCVTEKKLFHPKYIVAICLAQRQKYLAFSKNWIHLQGPAWIAL